MRECLFLEDYLGIVGHANCVLDGEFDGCKKHLHNNILEEDWRHALHEAESRCSTELVGSIASKRIWLQLWDAMLEQEQ